MCASHQSSALPRSRVASARPPLSRWRCRLRLEALESRELLSGAGATSDQLQEAYGRIPLSFEVNQGQTDSRVQYLARGEGYALFLTPTAAVFSLSKPAPTSNGHDQPAAAQPSVGTVLDMQLVGARPDAPASGLDDQASTV